MIEIQSANVNLDNVVFLKKTLLFTSRQTISRLLRYQMDAILRDDKVSNFELFPTFRKFKFRLRIDWFTVPVYKQRHNGKCSESERNKPKN